MVRHGEDDTALNAGNQCPHLRAFRSWPLHPDWTGLLRSATLPNPTYKRNVGLRAEALFPMETMSRQWPASHFAGPLRNEGMRTSGASSLFT